MNVDIDFKQDGKHVGFIKISHSTDESAYGALLIPIVSIRNGEGPKVLCTGGIHGDEFEGQIAWTHILQRLEQHDVRGQLIILPAVNIASAIASSRVSPIDNVNLNRCFPGRKDGSTTERIAHIIEHELLPMVDLVIDIHSGVSANFYAPSEGDCSQA